MAIDVGSIRAGLAFDLDETGADRFEARLNRIDRKKAVARLETKTEDRGIRDFETKLKKIAATEATAKLDLDKDRFDAALKEGEAQLSRLERRRAKADLFLDVDGVAQADAKIVALKQRIEHLRAEIKLDVDRGALSSLLGPLGFGGVSRKAREAGDSIGIFNRSMLTTRNAFSLIKFPALTVAIGFAAQALSALTAGAVGLTAALAPLSGLLGTLPGLFLGLGTAIGAGVLGFVGIGEAVKDSLKLQDQASTSAAGAMKTQQAAVEGVRRAKDTLTQSQRTAKIAQEDLTQARKDASRTLTDMKNQAKDAALAEEGSALALREARAELSRVTADPKSSQLDIDRALLGLKQARQGAKEARIEAARARADSEKVHQAGPGKLPQVVAAKRAAAEATRAEEEAERALTQARRDATQAQNESSSAADKLAISMAKLSPAGRRFVQTLLAMKPLIERLRATAQGGLLPGVTEGLQSAAKNFDPLNRVIEVTSRTMGRAAARFGEFFGSKGFGSDFEKVGRSNARIMDRLGRASVLLAKAFTNIAVAARPLSEWLSNVVLRFSRLVAVSTRAGRESGKMAGFFEQTRHVLSRLGSITQSVAAGFLAIGKAGAPLGRQILRDLDKVAQRFENWSESIRGKNELRDYFDRSKGPLYETAGLLGDITKSFLRLGQGPGVENLIRSVRTLVPVLERVIQQTTAAFGPALVDALRNILILVGDLAGQSGPLVGFVKTIDFFARALHSLFETIPGTRQVVVSLAGLAAVMKAFQFTKMITGFNLLRKALIGFGATKVGTSIAENLTASFTGAQVRIRGVLERMGAMMRRVFARVGIGAGQAAAEGVAGELGASAAAGGRIGRLRGRFGRLGRVLGIGLGIAIAGAAVKGFLRDGDFQERLRHALSTVTGGLLPDLDKDARNLAQLQKLVEGISIARVKELPKLKAIADQQSKLLGFTKEQRAELAKAFAERERSESRRPKAAKARKDTPDRIKTVEIQTPVLSLSAKTVERSMNRIQRVLQRELLQARRLIARQVDTWQDVFKGFRLLRGEDPLHLGSGIRKSADNARRALRGIVDQLGRVLERLSSLARIEGREVGSQLARGLGTGENAAVRAAERIRTGVNREFRLMQKGSSDAARDMVSNLRATFSRLPATVKDSTGEMLKIVLTAMRALGASGQARLSSRIDKIEGRAFGGMLPGYSRTDDRLVAVRGGEAVLRPEDHVPFISSLLSATKAEGRQPFGSLGEMFQRTGAAFHRGGEVGTATPYPSPSARPSRPSEGLRTPRFAKGGIVALGRRLQGMGYEVSEHSAFGGIRGRHDPQGYHPRDQAIDVNDDNAPQGEAKSLDKLFRLLKGQRKRLGIAELLWRVPDHFDHLHVAIAGAGARLAGGVKEAVDRVRARVKGPRGAIRDMVAGGVRKVEGAANRRLGKADSSANLDGFKGGGGSKANMALGRKMSRAVFGSDQWNALRELWTRESGWRTNADNPTSDAFGIPQSLPGSKMRSAGKDWRTNPATQIKWGLRYIKQRYGSPSAALRFHDSHNWYEGGGFVQALASGGFTFDSKRPAKALRQLGRSLASKPRSKGAKKGRKTNIRIKPYRLPRLRAGLPTGELSRVSDILSDRGSVARLQEDYDLFFEDTELVAEDYYPTLPSVRGLAGHRLEALPGGEQAIDWTAVESRGAELQGLVDRLNVIRAKYIEARDLIANVIIPRLKAIIQERQRQLQSAYRQLVSNINALQYVQNRLGQENQKKKPNKSVIGNLKNIITGLRKQNVDISGSPDKIVEAPRASESSIIGGIWGAIENVKQVWHGGGDSGANLDDQLFDIQGLTGAGGRLNDVGDLISQYSKELSGLGFVRQDAPIAAGQDAASKAQEVQTFFMALGDLKRQFAPNIQNFAGGGRVQGRYPGSAEVAIVHEGETVIGRDGKVQVVIKQPKDWQGGGKQVTLAPTIHYSAPEPEPHSLTKSLLFELKSAV